MKDYEDSGFYNESMPTKLREYPQLSQLLLDNLPGIFYLYTYPEMRLVFWNKLHESLLGYKTKEMGGRLATDWFTDEYKPAILAAIETVMENGNGSIEAPIMTKDGRCVHLHFTGVRFEVEGQLYFMGIGTDITERKQSEEALKVSESRYHTLVEWSPNAIFIHRNGKILYANPATMVMFGAASQEEMLTKPLIDLVHPDFRELVKFRVKAIFENNMSVDPVELKHLKLDGTVMNTEIQGKLIIYEGEPSVYVVIRDITERKKVELSLAETAKSLEGSLVRTLGTAARISELRDPYTSLHQNNVADLSVKIAQRMGLSEERVDEIQKAALVHDIGKVWVPSELLTKPSRLLPVEYEMLKHHAQAGFDVLKDSGLSETVREVVLQHHERLDGSGYPRGLKGDEILLEARIVAVADVVDAMMSLRPYRAALGVDAAMIELNDCKGTIYDFEVAEICYKILFEQKQSLKK